VTDRSIRLILVDDHRSFRVPVAFMLGRERDLVVVGQAGSLAEAREQIANGIAIDVALVDLDLPDGNGVDLIHDLRVANPTAYAVVLSGTADAKARALAVEAGASAVLHKAADVEEIAAAIRRLCAGETLIPAAEVIALVREASRLRERTRAASSVLADLTRRERDVLQAIADGLSDKQIADRLYVSPKTVRNHVAGLLDKLGVDSRLQALVLAIRHGIVSID
jgi:DNA-binding NarL/FixJ family response regulator